MTQADKIINWIIFAKPGEPMPPLIEDMPEVPLPIMSNNLGEAHAKKRGGSRRVKAYYRQNKARA